MRVLIACERSAIVRDAFRVRGHDAWSCDLGACEGDPRYHYQDDVFNCVASHPEFDFIGLHPECRFLSVSGFHWNYRDADRANKTEEALIFARRCFELLDRVGKGYLENSVSILSTRVRKPDQTVQPYWFGEDASKRTCFWIRGLPLLHGTDRFIGRTVEWPEGSGEFVERWSNQTDAGQNKLGPSETRSMDRARTYLGIAKAMAAQWG